MVSFAFNIVLAIVWAALIDRFDLLNLIIGYLVGAVVIAATGYLWEGGTYLGRTARVARLLTWATTEFVRAAIVAGLRALVPAPSRRPARAEVPVSLDRDSEMAALTLLISATGRSIPAGMTADHGHLVVEVPGLDQARLRASTERRLERWLLECLR